MAENSLDILVKRWAIVKRSLTNTEKFLYGVDLKPHKLLVRQDKLSVIWQEFKELLTWLQLMLKSKTHISWKGNSLKTDFMLFHLRLQLCLVNPWEVHPLRFKDQRIPVVPSWKLPTSKLPCFGSNYVEFLSFRNTFESLINNRGTDDLQRLHCLIASLNGKPKGLTENISIAARNFHVAWKLLVKMHNNREIIPPSMWRHC